MEPKRPATGRGQPWRSHMSWGCHDRPGDCQAANLKNNFSGYREEEGIAVSPRGWVAMGQRRAHPRNSLCTWIKESSEVFRGGSSSIHVDGCNDFLAGVG